MPGESGGEGGVRRRPREGEQAEGSWGSGWGAHRVKCGAGYRRGVAWRRRVGVTGELGDGEMVIVMVEDAPMKRRHGLMNSTAVSADVSFSWRWRGGS